MADKVFSVVDFKRGLDVRRTPLTAPGGSLRILENAVLNQGGEVEKRQAFASMTTVGGNPATTYMLGHRDTLHVFGVDAVGSITPGNLQVPAVYHQITGQPEAITEILDVEPFDDQFFVCMRGASGTTYCWYAGAFVHEADTSFSHGTFCRTWRGKMYRADGKFLRFSGINAPANNDPNSVTNPGAGFINIALNDPDGEDIVSMEVFYASMAIMARLETQIWKLDPDPTKDELQQLLRIGIVSPHSALMFGTGDVLFLSDSGVRSLKAQTLNLAANVGDVGSAIDPMLIPVIRMLGNNVHQADAIVQPIQGRYWLAIGDTMYVLSYFPAGDITAWSTFKPGFSVKSGGFAVVSNMVFVMDTANNIYLYGGNSRNQYDSAKVTVRTPHLAADNPTQNKRIKSVDVMCQGQWSVSVGMLPNNTDAFELAATIQDNTYGIQSIPFAGYGTHFGTELVHQAPGFALIGALHFNLQEAVVK